MIAIRERKTWTVPCVAECGRDAYTRRGPHAQVLCVHCRQERQYSSRRQRRIEAGLAVNVRPHEIPAEKRPATIRDWVALVGSDDGYEPPPPADEFVPCPARPGSDEKMRALQERVKAGLPLWHPADERMPVAEEPAHHD
jgi:hypothetical protein